MLLGRKGGLQPLEERLALRPTSETAIYSMFSKWVRSYKDLPLKIHQTCTIFRHETKNTKPLIRVREIHWNEAHCCHATAEDAVSQLSDYWKVIDTIFSDELCFKGQSYAAYVGIGFRVRTTVKSPMSLCRVGECFKQPASTILGNASRLPSIFCMRTRLMKACIHT